MKITFKEARRQLRSQTRQLDRLHERISQLKMDKKSLQNRLACALGETVSHKDNTEKVQTRPPLLAQEWTLCDEESSQELKNCPMCSTKDTHLVCSDCFDANECHFYVPPNFECISCHVSRPEWHDLCPALCNGKYGTHRMCHNCWTHPCPYCL